MAPAIAHARELTAVCLRRVDAEPEPAIAHARELTDYRGPTMSQTATRIHALARDYSGTELLHAAAARVAAEMLTEPGGTITVATLDEHVARYRALLLDALARATAGE